MGRVLPSTPWNLSMEPVVCNLWAERFWGPLCYTPKTPPAARNIHSQHQPQSHQPQSHQPFYSIVFGHLSNERSLTAVSFCSFCGGGDAFRAKCWASKNHVGHHTYNGHQPLALLPQSLVSVFYVPTRTPQSNGACPHPHHSCNRILQMR